MAIYPGLTAPRGQALLLIGVVAVALLGIGMTLGYEIIVTSGVALLGCEFVISLYVRQTSDIFAAAAFGSALLLISELAHWSLELGVHYRGGADVLRRRASAIAALVAASLVVGFSAATISQAPLPGGIALTVVGVGGVVAGIAIVAVVLWRGGGDRVERG